MSGLRSELMSTSARLDFAIVAGQPVGVRVLPEIDIQKKLDEMDLINILRQFEPQQEYMN